MVSQGKNVLRGERVVVNTETGDARMESSGDRVKSGVTANDRIRVIIQPAKDAKGSPTNTMSLEAPSPRPH